MTETKLYRSAYTLDGDRRLGDQVVKVEITGYECCAACYRVVGYHVRDDNGITWYTTSVWDTADEAARALAEVLEPDL